VLVRLLALLIALGLCAGVAQAATWDGTAAQSSFVEEAEDPAEVELAAMPRLDADLERTIDASASIMQPPRYQHLLFVFRPPRVPAFN